MDRHTFVLASLFILFGLAGCGEEPLGPASAMPDWVTAKATAGTDLTKMVYAVSDEGHSVMCPRSLWSHYDQLIRGK